MPQPFVATPLVIPVPTAGGLFTYRPNQVLVKFKKDASTAQIRARTKADARISKRRHFKTLSRHKGQDYYLLVSETESAETLKDRLSGDPTVATVSYNYAMTVDAAIPNDPNFYMQWPLNNTGQTFMPNTPAGTPGADIDAPRAWEIQNAADEVVIAVLDTGVDYEHSDLMDNIWTNAAEENGVPGVDDDGNGYVDDIFGIDTGEADTDPFGIDWHGTHIAGTIAAVGDNGIGVTGINWYGKVLAVKLSAADNLIYADSLIAAFEYIIDLKARGVNIVAANTSFGSAQYDTIIRDGITMLGAAGIILVASAGNDGVDTDSAPHYPSGYDLNSIISVTATDCDDALAGFSNYGSISTDLGAPGVNALSTYISLEYTPTREDTFFAIGVGIPETTSHSYAYASGTSMAAPHVSGALGLMAAHHPYESMAGRIYRILAGTDPLASLKGKTATGGRLNLVNSLLAIGLCEGEHLGGVADQDVDGVDLSAVAAAFNTADPSTDFDGSGITDAFDLGIFAADFGQAACP